MWVLLFALSIGALTFVHNDAFLYNGNDGSVIVRVADVENSFSHEEEGPDGENENYYDQNITAKILNGDKKGKVISLYNTYTDSGVNDERYYKGDRLMVSLNSSGDGGSITCKKRDTYVALFFIMFVLLLLIVSKKHGVVILVSFIINVVLLFMALTLYDSYAHILRITVFLMIIFSIITLIFAGGLHRKTWIAVISTLITVFLCWGIYLITRNTSERIPYEMMDYIVNPKDLADLFLAGTIMGSLGAVMDVSISISAGVSEVVAKTNNISASALIKSIREMGYDIMGTMINVLFFTYLSGTLPILIIKIKNGYTLYHLVRFQLMFEMICFLIGSIGIVLAIPVSGFLSALFFGKLFKKREGAG